MEYKIKAQNLYVGYSILLSQVYIKYLYRDADVKNLKLMS